MKYYRALILFTVLLLFIKTVTSQYQTPAIGTRSFVWAERIGVDNRDKKHYTDTNRRKEKVTATPKFVEIDSKRYKVDSSWQNITSDYTGYAIYYCGNKMLRYHIHKRTGDWVDWMYFYKDPKDGTERTGTILLQYTSKKR